MSTAKRKPSAPVRVGVRLSRSDLDAARRVATLILGFEDDRLVSDALALQIVIARGLKEEPPALRAFER